MASRMRSEKHGAGLMKGGWSMFRLGNKAGGGLLCVAVATLLLAAPALAQEKGPSDKSVQAFMRYAWSLLPEKFTPPNGKTIVVDKKKPKEIEVPIEVAREAVRVGYYSAQAQMCDLMEEQKANFDTLMLRQRTTAKWSDQQLLFIQKLHQVTVMIMAGKIVVVEKEGNVTVSQRDAKTNVTEQCKDDDRQRVKAQIAKYINAAPPPPPSAANAAQPVKTSTQKK
jgi:hypothetical protein